MPFPENVLATAAGVLLIAVAGRDIFDSLFHPEGSALLSRNLTRVVWRVFRLAAVRRPRLFPVAGPLALVTVIAAWALLLAVGWALVFWPHMPDGFRFADGVEGGSPFVDALNISLVTLTTVGFGDVTPAEDWLRLVAPLEALVGFGLLSASVSWLLLIYPVLSRRRSLAYELSLLREAEDETGLVLERLEPDAAERMYSELTSRLVTVERDLVSFPVSYYFTESDPRFALPAVTSFLLELAEHGAAENMPSRVRLRAGMLLDALDDLAATAADRFHGERSTSTAEGLRAYARDHLQHEPDTARSANTH